MIQKTENSRSIDISSILFSNRDPALLFHFESALNLSSGILLSNNELKVNFGRIRATFVWQDFESVRHSRLVYPGDGPAVWFGLDGTDFPELAASFEKMETLRAKISVAITELQEECSKLKKTLDAGSLASKKRVLSVWLKRVDENVLSLKKLDKPILSCYFSLHHFLFKIKLISQDQLLDKKYSHLLQQFFQARDQFVGLMERSQDQVFDSKEYSLFVKSFFALMIHSHLWNIENKIKIQEAEWINHNGLKALLYNSHIWDKQLKKVEKKATLLVECMEELKNNLRHFEGMDLIQASVENEIKNLFESQPLLTLLSSGVFEIKELQERDRKILVCLGLDVMASRFTFKSTGRFPLSGYIDLARLDSTPHGIDAKGAGSESEGATECENQSDEHFPLVKMEYMSMKPEELAQKWCDLESF